MNKILDSIKVIFVDLDNTLFDHIDKKGYDLKSIRYLNKLRKKGIKVIISTARPIFSIEALGTFKHLKYDGLIAANGAIRVLNGEWFDQYIFPKKTVQEYLRVCKRHSLCTELNTFDSHFYAFPMNEYVTEALKYYPEPIPEMHPYKGEDIISICLFAPKEMDNVLKNELPKDIIMLRFSPFAVDIVTKLHNKGEAVASFIKKMNVKKEECLAFGDDVQDISMFKEVGHPIAMGNAKEEVKLLAEFIIEPVNKHGIYRFLKSKK